MRLQSVTCTKGRGLLCLWCTSILCAMYAAILIPDMEGCTMSKSWVVWVDITHRIEVEADDMDAARDEAVDVIWDETNTVNCVITAEPIGE